MSKEMFHYNSTQQHTIIVNGKESTKRTSVSIHGKSGTKEVVIKEPGRAPQKKTMRLKPYEINCIRRCKFIPGLFSDCTPNCTAESRPMRAASRQQMTRKKRRIH